MENIPDDDNNKRLFQTTKFLKNRCRKIPPPPLKTGSTIHVTPQDKADILAEKFVSAHNNPLADDDPGFTQQIDSEFANILLQPVDPSTISSPSVNEITAIIKRLKNNKGPGIDKVHNTLLNNLPKSGILYKMIYIIKKNKHKI